MTSTLAGVAAALADDDPASLDIGVRRISLLYAIVFGYGGLPVISMGDEFAHGDNVDYLNQATRADDGRWAHKPQYDSDQADRRATPGTHEHRVFSTIQGLITARSHCLPLHAAAPSRPIDVGHPAVFAWRRDHPVYGAMVGLANVGSATAEVGAAAVFGTTRSSAMVDHLQPWFAGLHASGAAPSDPPKEGADNLITLAPYQVSWFALPGHLLSTVPATSGIGSAKMGAP